MGISGIRSTIREIQTKYKMEPSLPKTVYVEGSTDKAYVKLFLKQANLKDTSVVSIDSVEIPKNEIESLEIEDNNRGKIITLTTLIENHIIGIIDSDFDFIQEPTYIQKDNLLKTDYANMEMYLYNEESLDKILVSYPEKKNSKDFFKLEQILVDIFLITFAKKNLKNELKKIDLAQKDLFTPKSKIIEFNRDKYLNKYVKNNKELLIEFNIFIDKIKTKLPKDKRKIINGHNFVDLLQFYLEIKHDNQKETFTKSLYSVLEYNTIKEEEMFKKLLSLLNSEEK